MLLKPKINKYSFWIKFPYNHSLSHKISSQFGAEILWMGSPALHDTVVILVIISKDAKKSIFSLFLCAAGTEVLNA